MSFSDHNLSIVRRRCCRHRCRCCCRCRKLLTFSSSSTETLHMRGLISTKLGTKHDAWVKGIQMCSNEGPCPFPREHNYQIAKIH